MDGVGVVVAVVTYRRPSGLGELLRELAQHSSEARTTASILVVDNDDEPTAREVVGHVPSARYVHEPRPGIVAARNRALDESDPYRLLIFIDDDERPAPGWLDAMVATWGSSQAAAVAGPVVPRYTAPPDPWIEAGGFFVRPRRATGTEVPAAGAGNLLLDLEVVRRAGLRFDERFETSGGSDTFFTQSLVRLGHRIVWCDEAAVLDIVPPERLTRRWVLKRAQRMGNSRSRSAVLVAQDGRDRYTVRARLVAQGAIRLAGGGVRVVVGTLSNSAQHQARGARTLFRGYGMLIGALGGVVVGYRRSAQSRLGGSPT